MISPNINNSYINRPKSNPVNFSHKYDNNQNPWNIENTRKIEHISEDALNESKKYTRKTKIYKRSSNCIQLSMIILGAIEYIPDSNRKIISGVFSCLSSILGSIYVIFRISKKAIENEEIAAGFESLHAGIKAELTEPVPNRKPPSEIIEFSNDVFQKLKHNAYK